MPGDTPAPPTGATPQPRRRHTRRAFLGAVGLTALGTLAYGHWIEPDSFETEDLEIPSPFLPGLKGLRILHLADFHRGPFVPDELISRAVALGVAMRPDVICLTGDFITGPMGDPKGYADLLAPLRKCAPTFASPGNHDGDCFDVGRMLDRADIPLLRNRATVLTVRGAPLRLSGLGDLYMGACHPNLCLQPGAEIHRDLPTVLLSHNPDTKHLVKDYRWNLLLSGHTHGGQVRVPFVGPLYLPVKDTGHIDGLALFNGRPHHITRGVGNHYGIRINCRPRISLLRVV